MTVEEVAAEVVRLPRVEDHLVRTIKVMSEEQKQKLTNLLRYQERESYRYFCELLRKLPR